MAAPAEPLNLPPAAVPSSPLDSELAPPYWSTNQEYYRPQDHGTAAIAPRSRSTGFPTPGTVLGLSNPGTGDGATDHAAAETASIASTVLPSYDASTKRYGAYRNEAEYLAALKAWAEEREWVQLDGSGGLHGFYGHECLEDRSKRMKAERQAEKAVKAQEKARKASKAEAERGDVDGRPGDPRKSSVVGQWLGRRRQSAAV